MIQQERSCAVAARSSASFARSISGTVPPCGVGRIVSPKSIAVTGVLLAFATPPYATATGTRRAWRIRRMAQRMPTGISVQYALPITCPVMKCSEPKAR